MKYSTQKILNKKNDIMTFEDINFLKVLGYFINYRNMN